MAIDISLYISPLIVGSIAGCTLTSWALQRPRNLIKTMEEQNSQIDLIINETLKNKQSDELGKGTYVGQAIREAGFYTLHLFSVFLIPLPIISMYLIDFLEFVVIMLFLLSELLVLSTFFFYSNADAVRNFVTVGYISFISAILTMAFTHVFTMICAISENRRLNRIQEERRAFVSKERQSKIDKLKLEIELTEAREDKH